MEIYKNNQTKLYFVLGGPACGKSTLCKKIQKEFSFVHISVGELLMNEIEKESEIGNIIYEYIKNAIIVPNDITFNILMKEVSKYSGMAILVDGYPRNQENNAYFKKHVPSHITLEKVLFLDCDDNIMIERVKSRNHNNCVARFDDDPEIIKKRINTFKTQTMQVIDEYNNKKMLIHVDCSKHPDKIFDSIKHLFIIQTKKKIDLLT